MLRNELVKYDVHEVIDLAARADIEDVLLYDLEGICNFLKIDVPNCLTGRKGKAKMKALFRGCGSAYHEGERSESLIRALDMEKIIQKSPINLSRLVEYLRK